MRVYIESNGCNRRNSELNRICKYFNLNGYEMVNSPQKADYIFLNTCAFKKREEDYSISRIRVLKDYPAKLIVYGCLPDIAPSKFEEFSDIAHLAPRNIDKIDSYFKNITFKFSEIKDSSVVTDYINLNPLTTAIQKFKREFEFSNDFCLRIARHAEKRIKTTFGLYKKYLNLFICRGCLGNCSYCAIRRAIGSLESQPVELVVRQFKEGFNAGYRDFVILGDDVGAYGQDINNTFPELFSRLIDESNKFSVQSSPKLKKNGEIGFYIEELSPKWLILFNERLLDLFRAKQIRSILCPIQSGSDRILKLMNRHHNSKGIADHLLKLRTVNPEIQLSTHIIIGFPSETEEDFDKTLDLLNKIHFDIVVIFPYHEKENTPAIRVNPKIPDDVIRERVKKAQKYFKKQKIKVYLSCPGN
jgi:MiaB/RimO family radical SAM methylthiotransferase